MAIPLDTAVLKLATDDQSFNAGLDKAAARAAALGGHFDKTTLAARQTAEQAKALGYALEDVFGTKLEARANASVEAIRRMGGAAKLTDDEAKSHLKTLDAWLAKAKALGKDVPDSMRATRAQLAGVNAEAGKTPGILGSIGSRAVSMAGALGLAFSAGAVVNWVRNVADAAGKISDIAVKVGVSTEAVQRWSYAAEQGGASIDTVNTAVSKMNEVLGEGNKSTVAALRLAGLEFDAIRKMRPEDAFNSIVGAIEKIEDPMTAARVAVDLFGRSGQDLLPAIRDGFLEVGASITVMSDETVQRLDAAGDAWARLYNAAVIYSGEIIGRFLSVRDQVAQLTPEQQASYQALLRSGGVDALGRNAEQYLASLNRKDINLPDEQAPQRRAAAAREAARALAEEEAAQRRASKAAADRLALDQKIAAAKIPLTEAQKEHIRDLMALGIAEADIAKALGVSAIAVSRYAEAWKKVQQVFDSIDFSKASMFTAPARVDEIVGASEIAPTVQGIVAQRAVDAARGDWLNATGGHLLMPVGAGAVDPSKGGFWNLVPRPSDPGFWSSTFGGSKALGANLSGAAMGAIMGGGSVTQALGGTVGGQLASGIATTATKALGSKAVGSMIGGALGTVLPGIGNIIGAWAGGKIGEWVGGLFGKGKGRQVVEEFAQSMGGFDPLREKLNALGAEGETLWKKLTQGVGKNNPEQAKAVIDEITKALEASERKTQQFNASLGGMLGQIKALGGSLPDSLREYLRELERGGKLTAENIALLEQLSGDGEVSWRAIEEAAERYGADISQLGGTFQSQRLHELWQQVIDDIDLFARGNVDAGKILEITGSKIVELAQQSLKFGTEIPENMRKWIAMLIESGQLLDENGEAITDINTLTFGETLQTTLQKLTDSLEKLVDTFRAVPAAVSAIPRRVDIDVNVHENRHTSGDRPPGMPGAEYAATGGLVTSRGIRYFGGGGWVPRGTDTVPAMLTPGEGVLNRKAMAMLGEEALHALNAGRGLGSLASTLTGVVQHLSVSIGRREISRAVFEGFPREFVMQGGR